MKYLLIASLLLVTGCVSQQNASEDDSQNACITSQFEAPVFYTSGGCATQYNSHWAVMNKKYISSSTGPKVFVVNDSVVVPNCDLVFFKHEGPDVNWENIQKDLIVNVIGNGLDGKTPVGIATVTDINVFEGCLNVNLDKFVSRKYSGGPMIDSNGYVVGISAGNIDDNHGGRIGVGIPYQYIQQSFNQYVKE